MRAWQFSKPKGPGFGISSNFYLTVLSSKPTLPALLEAIAPGGEHGSVEGFGVPLGNAGDKSVLAQPMTRGAYALASKDRKTLVKMLILSKEEAGFDPEPFAMSSLAAESDAELVTRIRSTWIVLQLAFETHDPEVYPAVKFMLDLSKRLAELTDGVVADSISRRYLLPEKVFHIPTASDKLDARDVVAISYRTRPDGIHCFTLGMQKFALPEFEIYGVEDHSHDLAAVFLLGLCQTALLGKLAEAGAKAGSSAMPFEIRNGGLDRAMWEGIDCFELLPPTRNTATEALISWAEESGVVLPEA